ncbi:signal transduction histidine kinase [Murinocardiopsis flavida]|uniref:histidine kinase n=1 Tax=Murinocardiopsis flavida TaxID=645275 RepID=A0A2P8D508_9ACTN|nr:sensor histidine kinase [Murinocardiopsis flavida]PSK92290.1 signal transduction histidine kinase [Murinocardiopsis flavida]
MPGARARGGFRSVLFNIPLALLIGFISLVAAAVHASPTKWGPAPADSPDQPDGPPWADPGAAGQGGPSPWELPWPVYVFVLLLVVAIVVRRLWPRSAFAAAVIGTAGYLLFGGTLGPVLVGPALALLALSAVVPLRTWATWAVLLAPMLVAASADQPYLGAFASQTYSGFAFSLAFTLAPAAFGAVRRTRAEAARREREQELQSYAFEERLRIAREVHDVVGHSLSVITMQAGVALHVLHKRPDQVETSLEAIRRTSKDALEELRGTLAVFRDPGPEDRDAPLPGLDRLDDLVSALGSAGRQATVRTEGAPHRPSGGPDSLAERELPAAVDHAAYRIIQEALTNVTRHAPGATADVRIVHGDDRLVVEITDDGAPLQGGAPREGNGILGMRERARAVGGTLYAGPRPDHGFRVRAELPLPAHERATTTAWWGRGRPDDSVSRPPDTPPTSGEAEETQ